MAHFTNKPGAGFAGGLLYAFKQPVKLLPLVGVIIVLVLHQFYYQSSNLQAKDINIQPLLEEKQSSAQKMNTGVRSYEPSNTADVHSLTQNISHRYFFFLTQMVLTTALLLALGCGAFITWQNLKNFSLPWVAGLSFLPLLATFIFVTFFQNWLNYLSTPIRQMIMEAQHYTQIDYIAHMEAQLALFFVAMTFLALAFSSLAIVRAFTNGGNGGEKTKEQPSVTTLRAFFFQKTVHFRVLFLAAAVCLVSAIFVSINLNYSFIILELPQSTLYQEEFKKIVHLDLLSKSIFYSLLFVVISTPAFFSLTREAKIDYLEIHPGATNDDITEFLKQGGLHVTWKTYLGRVITMATPILAGSSSAFVSYLEALL